MPSRERVFLVIGAGAGIGFDVAKRFAKEGYAVCLCRRSDNDGLQRMVQEIEQMGVICKGYLLNAIQPGAIEDLVNNIETDVGQINVALYNLGAQIGDRALEDTSLKTFTTGWQLACMGLFRLAKVLSPKMIDRGSGTLLVVGCTQQN